MAEEVGDVELDSVSDDGSTENERESLVFRPQRNITITREPQNERHFEAGHTRIPKSRTIRHRILDDVFPEPIRSSLTPPLTREAWLEFLLVHIPIIRWLLSYQTSFIISDIVAGLTVAIMHIPQGLAYALLADLPAVYGLYASFVPAIIYSVVGSSRHISVGTFAVVQLMVGNTIHKTLSSDLLLQTCLGNGTLDTDTSSAMGSGLPNDTAVDCDAEKASIAITIAMVSGVIMLLMGLLQLGFISMFLSESLVSGYTTGAALHVFTSQLTHILGISNKVPPGLFQVPRTWIKSLSIIDTTNVPTLLVSVVAMAALIGFKVLNKWLKKRTLPVAIYSVQQRKWSLKRVKWTIPIPAPLVVLIVATLISFLASFEKNFDVIIVGHIPPGVPAVSNPFTRYLSLSLIVDSFVVAIVVYSVSVSLARKFAVEHEYTIHSNQEFIAYGLMNIVGSFFSSFTAAASLSRSLIQSNGGKTQLVGFISSAIILVVLLWLGSLFEPLPRAVLAATIWVALWGMFSQVKHAWTYFKLSISDALIWVAVFVATALLGVDTGLIVGVAFSLCVIIYRIVMPYSSVLGRAKDTEIFRNNKNFQVDSIEGVLIFRFMAPICFVNASVFRSRLELECDLHKRRPSGGEEKGCLQKILPPAEECCRRRGKYSVTSLGESGEGREMGESGEGREGGEGRESGEGREMGEGVTESERDLRVRPTPRRRPLVRTVVIDCAPISFLDAVGVKVLKQLVINFDKCDVQVLFAAMTEENRNMLDRAKFYDVCGKEWLFPTIQDAVHHAQYNSTLHPAKGEGRREGERETDLNLSNGDIPSLPPRLQEEPHTTTTESQSQENDGDSQMEVVVADSTGSPESEL